MTPSFGASGDQLLQPLHLVHGVDVGPLLGMRLQQGVQHLFAVGRQLADDFFANVIAPFPLVSHQLAHVLIVEWHDRIQHDEQNHAKRPDVALGRIVGRSADDFWRSVGCGLKTLEKFRDRNQPAYPQIRRMSAT